MNLSLLINLLILTLTLSACTTNARIACQKNERIRVMDALYFGTAKPDGIVSNTEWNEFIKTTVTSRFPQGLTAWEAAGQWQKADGNIQYETTHILHLAHPESKETEIAVQAIITQYKRQFRQESVLRVRSEACSSS